MNSEEIVFQFKELLDNNEHLSTQQQQALKEVCRRYQKPFLTKEDIAFITKTILELLSVAIPLLHH